MNRKQLLAKLEKLRIRGLELAGKEGDLTEAEEAELAQVMRDHERYEQQLAALDRFSSADTDGGAGGADTDADADADPAGDGDTADDEIDQRAAAIAAKAIRQIRSMGGNFMTDAQRRFAPAMHQSDEAPKGVEVSWAIKGMLSGRFDRIVMPLSPYNPDAYKALAETIDSSGGYLVPTERSNQIVALLRAKTAVRAAGATVVPMKSDSLEIPKQTGGATAYWLAENAQITASDQSFGMIQLFARKLGALTKMPSELFEDSDPAVESLVMADLARVLALEEDIKYLRGDGTSNAPVGLRNLGATVTSLGTNGAAPTFDNLADCVYRLDADNVPNEGRAWIVHPRTVNTLRKIKDSNNKYLWADPNAPGDPPTVWGYPVYTTTAIPINLTHGSSSAASEIYFGAWGEAIIGQRKTVELRASDAAGNAFEYDQVFIRAIMRVAFNARYLEAFEILSGVIV